MLAQTRTRNKREKRARKRELTEKADGTHPLEPFNPSASLWNKGKLG